MELVQTLISTGALIVALVAIILQARTLRRTEELSAGASLLSYYNSKISSLRNSLWREKQDREDLRLQSHDEKIERLDELLTNHKKVTSRLEELFGVKLADD